MDLGLFLLGMLGAVLTVLIAKQQIIPEFRPLVDVADSEIEATRLREQVEEATDQLGKAQLELEKGAVAANRMRELELLLKTGQAFVQQQRARLENLERTIRLNTAASRGIGFLLYIVLGGVLGSLLGGKIKIDTVDANLPAAFQSILIGATWTTYLGALGFQADQAKVEESQKKAIDLRIEDAETEVANQLDTLKKNLVEVVPGRVEAAERSPEVRQPQIAPEVADLLKRQLENTGDQIKMEFAGARLKAREDFDAV